MEQHDIDAELTDARELLDSASSGHLGYIAQDGTPRVVPVGFYWTGEQFVIATAATAPKVAALTARPDVALSFEPRDGAEQLSIRGRADIHIVDGVVEEYLMAARKNMDAESAAQFEHNCREMYDQMARIAITPRWARYYDFGAGRMPKFLRELADQ